jgi:hypothetical protein
MVSMGRRQEIPPEQQLEDLRMASDYYRGVADRIRDGEDNSSESPEHRQAREQYARRISAAYEISFNTQNALIRKKHGIE